VVFQSYREGVKRGNSEDATKDTEGPGEAGKCGIFCCCWTRCEDEAPERRKQGGAKRREIYLSKHRGMARMLDVQHKMAEEPLSNSVLKQRRLSQNQLSFCLR
jgi:hypothetical protein